MIYQPVNIGPIMNKLLVRPKFKSIFCEGEAICNLDFPMGSSMNSLVVISFELLCLRTSYDASTYPGVRFSKSMDLVSISPLRLRYSKMIPGGWYLSKNLFNFIFFV